MTAPARQIERYLHDTLDVPASLRAWPDGRRLPHFLREQYGLFEMSLLGRPCILMVDSAPAEQSAAVVRKHAAQVREKSGKEAIYVRPSMTAYNRKRLIEQKVPFIVPGNQLYLPELGIDLREHFRRLRSDAPSLSPAAQVALLDVLLHRPADEPITPGETARRLGYSAMTMTRAFDEMDAAKLGETSTLGRERRFHLAADKRTTWTQAQPWLRNPVGRRLSIHCTEPPERGMVAGLSALARRSALAPPPRPVVALGPKDWKVLRSKRKVIEVPALDPDACEIELWAYPPALLADRDMVDPLSLCLSLKDDADERVQAALEETMEALPW